MLTATQPFFRPSLHIHRCGGAVVAATTSKDVILFEGAQFHVEFRAEAKQSTQLSVVTQYRRGN